MSKKPTLVALSEVTDLTPLQAIRANCIECSGNSSRDADTCHLTSCKLHYYRFGTNPNRKGIGGQKTHRRQTEVLNDAQKK